MNKKDGVINIVKTAEDLTGMVFGRLTVIDRADDYVYPNGKRRSRWLCKCSCGKEICIETSNLKRGNSKSCGCLDAELKLARSTTHGGRYERLYSIWTNLKTRCNNPHNENYKDYGERGISLCKEWEDFGAFRDWAMQSGFKAVKNIYDCTIDRIDVNGNYCPENCRWANAKQQANNRRNTLFVTAFGETHSLSEWADITGVKYHTLFARIKKLGWSPEKALTN